MLQVFHEGDRESDGPRRSDVRLSSACTRSWSGATFTGCSTAVLAGVLFLLVPSTNAAAQDFEDFDKLMEKAESRAGVEEVPTPRNSGSSTGTLTLPPPGLDRDTQEPRFDETFRLRSDDATRREPGQPLTPSRNGQDPPEIQPLERFAPTSPNARQPFEPAGEADTARPGVLRIQEAPSTESVTDFNWREQTTSVADLRFPSMDAFRHGEAFLSGTEEAAYLELLDTIRERRRALVRRTTNTVLKKSASTGKVEVDSTARVSGKGVAEWQEAFYEFPEARRLAWNNGHLRGKIEHNAGGLPDPFAPAKKDAAAPSKDTPYQLLDDIRRYPQHFVGRPIVLYGRYQATSVVRLGGADPNATTYEDTQFGAEATTPKTVRLMRGRLVGLTSAEDLAVVDTTELLTPQLGSVTATSWPGEEESIPVMVKGWVVKRWDNRPLIYCESMRQISPIPHFQLIRRSAFDRSRLRDGEKWLYYETLTQMELTSHAAQQNVANTILNQRIDELMTEVEAKAKSDLKALQADLKSAKINEAQFDRRKVMLQRQLDQRIARYRRYRKHPETFQTFVDVFQHPDFWHGHVVSLRGHVRHVVSYPGDQKLFNGRMLHELWLFTDDSQHNPAVIITPNLPEDFPTEADVIDGVSVTGCFYKRYIYGSQDADRIAPLLLAGRIHWTPTVDQVQTLVADGQLDADSARAVKAAKLSSGLGEAALMLVCFLIILTFMMFWGRAQREERDRLRLRKRINDVSDGYSPALSGPGSIGDYIPDEYRVDGPDLSAR